jgi:hypothetical protein
MGRVGALLHRSINVIASEAKQSISQRYRLVDGLLRRKRSSQLRCESPDSNFKHRVLINTTSHSRGTMRPSFASQARGILVSALTVWVAEASCQSFQDCLEALFAR